MTEQQQWLKNNGDSRTEAKDKRGWLNTQLGVTQEQGWLKNRGESVKKLSDSRSEKGWFSLKSGTGWLDQEQGWLKLGTGAAQVENRDDSKTGANQVENNDDSKTGMNQAKNKDNSKTGVT